MRALLDEHLSARIAALLRRAGHDVDAVVERADLLACSDEQILEQASKERRAVVTNNVTDFRPLAARWLADGRVHSGLILLPAARTRTGEVEGALADAVAAVLIEHPDGIVGSERWIGPLLAPRLEHPR